MAARKTKSPKAKKNKAEKDPDAPKPEVDAVKGFIFVMIILTVALGVFQFVKSGELSEVENDLRSARANGPRVRDMSNEIQAYLDLIRNSEETVLLKNPETFFKNIYSSNDVRAPDKDVTVGKKEDQRNAKDRYTEYYWDIDIRNLDRRAVAAFMWWVENKSPKAKSIDVLVRRQAKKDETEVWDGRFRIGYRIATAK